ncbi:MAG: hypothetical protein P1U64_07465 [Alcanivoracaceae bacterium]|nr:hypothetical protein [Alcanivoracaceae bacterium]
MHTPLLQTPHENRPPADNRSHQAHDERERLVDEINRQPVRPEPGETLAMAMIVLVFVGAVLAFSMAATQML